jgi:hypothetical protein
LLTRATEARKELTQREELIDISGKGVAFSFWNSISL